MNDNSFVNTTLVNLLFSLSLIFSNLAHSNKLDTYPNKIIIASSGEKFLDLVVQRVMSKALREYQIKFYLEHFPKERALISANNGIIDGDAYRVANLHELTNHQYSNLLRVDVPYTQAYLNLFTAKPELKIKHWQDLKGYIVGYVKGNKIVKQRLAQYMNSADIIKVTHEQQAFKMLARNRLDVLITGEVQDKKYLKNNNILKQTPLEEMDIYLYLHKKHQKLIPILENKLKLMQQDGTLASIRNEVLNSML